MDSSWLAYFKSVALDYWPHYLLLALLVLSGCGVLCGMDVFHERWPYWVVLLPFFLWCCIVFSMELAQPPEII
jgi:hypothetical protein